MISISKTRPKMRIDTFLTTDPIKPFENRKIEKTEAEKDRLRKELLAAMHKHDKLPD